MLNVLFAAKDERWPLYEAPLKAAFKARALDVDLRRDHSPQDVDYIVYAPNSSLKDFTPYIRTKAVLNLWAGVEAIAGNETLTMPLTRMSDFGLTQGMIEWVTGHTLRHHLGMDAHIVNPDHVWKPRVPPLSRDRPVTVLGMGQLGAACAQSIAGLGFPVTGWSRSPKHIDGVHCVHGEDGLHEALSTGQIVILLLPNTPATQNTLNAETLGLMPKGSFIINPGRGPLIDDDALLAALDSGQIAHATLDVFRIEPLPADHPYWSHPSVTVTPHIAAETRAETSAEVVADNIALNESGKPMKFLVDRDLGY